MANTRFTQFVGTKHGSPVFLDVRIPIGATGAVGTLGSGAGISSVTRNAAGIYQINLLDSYNKYLGLMWSVESPNSGSDVLVASAGTVSGTTYVITTVGTTTTAGWQSLGLGVGITPAVGVAFKATATTTATGTGAVQTQINSGIVAIESLGVPSLSTFVTGVNALTVKPYVIIQTLAATNSSTTTLVPTDPVSGCALKLVLYFSNSSNVSKNNG